MSTMTKRIFRATLLVGVAVLIASLALVMGVLYSYFGRVQESQLRDELSLAAVGVEKNGTDYLRALQSHQYRITWVRADGTVVYDTQVDAETMENHAQRQEIQQALAAGEGESSRYSSTLLQKTVYYAQRLPDGTDAASVRRPGDGGGAGAEHAAAHSAGAGGGADPVGRAGRAAGTAYHRAAEPAGSGASAWRTIPTRSWRRCCGAWSTSAARSTGRWASCGSGRRSLTRSPAA